MTKNWSEIIEKLDYAFQPIIHTHTGKIFAVEALLRNTDNINAIFDSAFDEDILYEIDLLLREKAIEKFSLIKIENLKLFYNLDNRIIYSKNFSSGNTRKILEKFNLCKNTICFELSEKGSQIEQNALSTMIQTYKKNGYCIAIDDFGIGVSGLKLLYFSEANVIKVDRFFITNIQNDSKKKLFCSSIIDMAHIMGMKVVAEGVEEINEYYTCKDIGVDFIQGYLVQKPTVKVEEIKATYNEIVEIIQNDKRSNNTQSIDDDYIDFIQA